MLVKEVITKEFQKLIDQTKLALNDVKRIALSEAWKILQLAIATVIQIIESLAVEYSGPDKKVLAMELISKFYDSVFTIVDIPVVPNILEPIIHKYVKAFLLVLVGSTIDAMVTTFRNIGIFQKKQDYQGSIAI